MRGLAWIFIAEAGQVSRAPQDVLDVTPAASQDPVVTALRGATANHSALHMRAGTASPEPSKPGEDSLLAVGSERVGQGAAGKPGLDAALKEKRMNSGGGHAGDDDDASEHESLDWD
mmetsp:Transcript_2836/g.6698  ORF Transcript_2836/g.6698 Transcript_2836/m.6698 type:complete len:117 (-) Transcript_2836:142-492(-)